VAVPLVKHPDARLRKPAALVRGVSRQVQERIILMLEAMRHHGGIGLAAPQIGWDARVFVTCHSGQPADDAVFINPHSLTYFGDDVWDEEQCLSLPGETCRVMRSEKVTLKALDVDGVERTIHASGLLARIVDHENDHLFGRLLIDKRHE
jgi:peptide deformylase